MEQLDRLLKNAYLFEDPRSYQAGVRDTIAMIENAADGQREHDEAGEIDVQS